MPTSTATVAPTSAATPTAPVTPTAYAANRWDENYTYLKDPATHGDFFDPIKYIPLNANGDWYLSLGGQVRYRYEFFKNNLFGAGVQDSSGYSLTRLLTDVDLHLGPNVRIFGQIKDSFENGRHGSFRAVDEDEFNIQQLFLDVNLPLDQKNGLLIRAGRQDLLYGAERLISPLDWTNVRRTFEGLRTSLTTPNNKLDVFWVRPIVVQPYRFDNGNGRVSFEGVYDTVSLPDLLPKAGTTVDVYGLGLNSSQVGKTKTHVDTYTAGTRLASKPGNFDFDFEGDYQFGRVGKADIDAFSVALLGGYTFKAEPLKPRVGLGFDIASGDHRGTDPAKQTFNQLFPLGHKYFGFIDVIGRQNIVDLHPEVTFAFTKNITGRVENHWFWREDSHDSVYDPAGNVVRAASTNKPKFIGDEIDFLANWQIDRHWSTYAGYSHFFAGSFLQGTGANKDIDFAYLAVSCTF